MWHTLEFEKCMLQKLIDKYGDEKGENIFTDYKFARNSLIDDNFFKQIQGAEQNLTDHSERHIANVMDNAYNLLGGAIEKLTALETYCLGLIILFHDVGNIEGRKNHNKKITEVYDSIRNKKPRYNREKSIVISAGRAHCGLSKNNSRDTLIDLEDTVGFNGEPIKLQNLAAILRFADELAEGPQRTSQFMIEKHKYDKDSEIFHNYASITHILIDRPGGRVSITYDIDIDTERMKEDDLKKLLDFTYKRIIKLDEERRYNKHYCEFLIPFKKTSVQFNFFVNGIPTNLDLGKIELTDRFPVPGEGDDDEKVNQFLNKNPDINIENIWKEITNNVGHQK